MISIIISVLNGGNTLKACLDSIITQDYTNYELIIIDGGSSDATLDIINHYKKYVHYSISEVDSGIYNAWNKALRVARGDWICFVGCDDQFSTNSSLSQLIDKAQYPFVNYVSGKVALVNSNDVCSQPHGVAFDAAELSKGMKFCHPGSLHHISLFREYGLFNEQYKIAGDYEFFVRCHRFIRPAFIHYNILLIGDSGISNQNQILVFFEGFRILCGSHDFGVLKGVNFLFISLVKMLSREIIYRKIPSIYSFIVNYFNKIN